SRGKRNPANQAKGFINGVGGVPNPGFGKGDNAFMPEVKSFSFSTIAGYSNADGARTGKRNSVWLSLVPAAWQEGLKVVPGTPTHKPEINPEGPGPALRTAAPPPAPGSEDPAEGGNTKKRPTADASNGCACRVGSPRTDVSREAAFVVFL